ncbi:MAG: hypothetical protein EA376_14325 [Phycisphaeraceae bacterium]|nr:MAG: hypothetical protein EA376_14325 [Phycisphaeraceae bacterium]
MNHDTKSPQRTGLDTPAALLWTSAFLIMAMILTQAARLGAGSPALAGNVATIGDLTVLTADAGDSEDILMVLDRRTETLLIYGARDRRDVELHQTYDLSRVFSDARGASGLGRRP